MIQNAAKFAEKPASIFGRNECSKPNHLTVV